MDVMTWLRRTLELDPVRHKRYFEKIAVSGLHGALLFWDTYVCICSLRLSP